MKSIETVNGIFYFNEISLYYGRKRIDINICTSNLLDLKSFLDDNEIPFGLIFGTLLGAIRNNSFIEHDEDVDIYIFDKDRSKLLSLLFNLEDIGFNVARYNKNLISIIREDDYIDIYFMNTNFLGFSFCDDVYIPKKFIKSFEVIQFLGESFNVPADYNEILLLFYGESWRIPKVDYHAQSNSISFKFKKLYFKLIKLIKIFLPNFIIVFINEKYEKIKK